MALCDHKICKIKGMWTTRVLQQISFKVCSWIKQYTLMPDLNKNSIKCVDTVFCFITWKISSCLRFISNFFNKQSHVLVYRYFDHLHSKVFISKELQFLTPLTLCLRHGSVCSFPNLNSETCSSHPNCISTTIWVQINHINCHWMHAANVNRNAPMLRYTNTSQ